MLVTRNPDIVLWISTSVIKTKGLSTFPIKDNPVFNAGPKIVPKNSPDCPSLYKWVFDSFILADEPFGKAVRRPRTYALVNNNLCGKLFSW